jgi:predicted transcriptional regulator
MKKLNKSLPDSLELNSKNDSIEEWNLLPEFNKRQIIKGLAEADAGMGTPSKEVIQKAREKYGLNGYTCNF